MKKELRLFRKVKKLVLEAESEEPKKIHEVLPQIAALFPQNVDKTYKNEGRKYQKYSLVVSVISFSLILSNSKD
jgi:hypothetical protein